jgi:hypothetical protein
LDLASASTPKEGREGGSGVTAPRLQQRMLAVAPMVDGGGFELVGWGLGEGWGVGCRGNWDWQVPSSYIASQRFPLPGHRLWPNLSWIVWASVNWIGPRYRGSLLQATLHGPLCGPRHRDVSDFFIFFQWFSKINAS